MSIADNIKKLREKHKLTQEEFGKIAGVSDKAVSTWELGAKIPRMGTIQKISEYFNIPKSAILDDTPAEKSNIAYIIKDNIYNIPLFGSVSAGFGAYASDEVLDYIPTIIRNPYEACETLAIRVTGNSMYPKIEDGDIIVVHKQESVDSGSIAVMLLDGEEGVVKKVEYGPDWIDLVSINPEYQTRHFEGVEVTRLRVLGLVRQIVKTV